MTMSINIKDQYLDKFEQLLKQMPNDSIEIKKSLDEEINKRVEEYQNCKMETVPFGEGLDKIREKIVSQI